MVFSKTFVMKFILIASLSLLIIRCKNSKELPASLPVCVKNKIEAIKTEHKWNPPAQVAEYNYNGKRVFLFSSDCCDQYNMLYDENCNSLCAPSGGLTGKGDNKCDDFFNTAKYVKLIWKDSR